MKTCRWFIVGFTLLLLLVFILPPISTKANSEVNNENSSIEPAVISEPESPSALITWFTHDVDTTSARGRYNDIAIDSNGFPHITYIDESTADLMYAFKDSGGWHRYIMDGYNPVETIGWGTALTLDADNDPHILYFGSMDVRYMFRSGGGWYKEFVDPSIIADGGDIFYGSDGTVYASYHEALTDMLFYAERNKDNGIWSQVLVNTTLSPGHNTSLVVDNYGGRAISYSRYENPALLIARSFDGVNWNNAVIDSDVGTHATHTDMAMAVGGIYNICYFDQVGSTYQLKVAVGIGNSWNEELVDPAVTVDEQSPEIASECSVAYAQNGTLHLAYFDAGALYYAYRDQGGWHSGTMIEAADLNQEPAGRHNGLALGPDDLPQVSYDYSYSPTLKHADVAIFFPEIIGDTSCPYGSRDCNRCAYDVVNSVNKLSTYGEPLGFHIGAHPEPSFNPFTKDFHGHFQGVQRVSTTSGDYLVVSQDDMKSTSGDWSGLGIVRLTSRDGDGYRWRSNRLLKNLDFEYTAPPDPDMIVTTVWITNEHDHPGGFQILGDYLAVGTDHLVHLYDLANPEAPIDMGVVLDRPGFSSSTTSLAKLADGHYLLVVSNSDAEQLDFYFSSQPNSISEFIFYDSFHKDEVLGGDWHAYQNMNLVTECGTGDVYLIGTYNGGWFKTYWGEDRAVVYSIQKSLSGEIILEEQLSKHLHCAYRGEADCNFDAAAGIYVDPSGQIILYSTEHDNDGPKGNDSKGTVKVKEFRPVPHNSSCESINDAWIELYDDHDFNDRNLMIDYIDRTQEDYSNYHNVEDFDNKPTSVRWCLPSGWRYSLYWHNTYAGKELALYGTGKPREISDLKDHNFNEASSSKFVFDAPVMISISDIYGDNLYYRRPSGSTELLSIEEELDQIVGVDVEVPPGAVSQVSDLTLTPVYPPAYSMDGYFSPDGIGFNLDLSPGGSGTEFLTPITLKVLYDPLHVDNMDANNLAIYIWDNTSNTWTDAAQTCSPTSPYNRDPGSAYVETRICRTGEFILMGEREYRVYLPNSLNLTSVP